MTDLRMMAVSVVLTFETGDATTSWDTSQGDSLLRDGVTVFVVGGDESRLELPDKFPLATSKPSVLKNNIFLW